MSQALFKSIEETSSPALSRVLRQLDSSTYQLFSFNAAVEVAFFENEELAYIVQDDNLMLIDKTSSARSALDTWLEESLASQA